MKTKPTLELSDVKAIAAAAEALSIVTARAYPAGRDSLRGMP